MATTVRVRANALALFLAIAVVAAAATACESGPARAQHISAGCPGGGRVALTFDDGPNPPFTDSVLDLLTGAHVTATFFVEGEAAEANPAAVKREATLGMAVGSHSFSHADDLASSSQSTIAGDTARADDALAAALGYRPSVYRAPYGRTSPAMLSVLRSAGYTSIGWDVDSADWSDADVDAIVSNVVDHVHPGAIILMHDGGLGGGNPDRSRTLSALPRIIEGLRARGYTFATVPELIGVLPARIPGTHREATCSAS